MKNIKAYIKKTVIKLVNPVITLVGYKKKSNYSQEYSFNKNSLLNTFYINLISVGFIPKHIVDVGANRGTWTREALKYFPDAYFTLIEPQNWLKGSFEDILNSNDKVQYYPVGAGGKEGSLQFTIVDQDDSCTFRYTQEEAKAAGFQQREISVVTLNSLFSQNKWPVPDIIKIDAEGLDIEVLKGSDNFFGKTEIFMVEAGVCNQIFDNSFLKVINFMDKKGYRLFDITDLNRPFIPKLLWLVELVFVKKNGFLDRQGLKL